MNTQCLGVKLGHSEGYKITELEPVYCTSVYPEFWVPALIFTFSFFHIHHRHRGTTEHYTDTHPTIHTVTHCSNC